MQLKVITKDGIKSLSEVIIGEEVLTDSGCFTKVKSILVTRGHGNYIKLGTGFFFHTTDRTLIKTSCGFKKIELWDVVEISAELTPLVVCLDISKHEMFLYDILIEDSLVSPEGIVFRFGNSEVNSGKAQGQGTQA